LIDTGDVHALMIGAAGVGKTAYWLYPCMNMLVHQECPFYLQIQKVYYEKYGTIAKDYGYNVSVIDLRNPTRSNGNNLPLSCNNIWIYINKILKY
jgi:type IV secretion system protein VirD4